MGWNYYLFFKKEVDQGFFNFGQDQNYLKNADVFQKLGTLCLLAIFVICYSLYVFTSRKPYCLDGPIPEEIGLKFSLEQYAIQSKKYHIYMCVCMYIYDENIYLIYNNCILL